MGLLELFKKKPKKGTVSRVLYEVYEKLDSTIALTIKNGGIVTEDNIRTKQILLEELEDIIANLLDRGIITINYEVDAGNVSDRYFLQKLSFKIERQNDRATKNDINLLNQAKDSLKHQIIRYKRRMF